MRMLSGNVEDTGDRVSIELEEDTGDKVSIELLEDTRDRVPIDVSLSWIV